MKWKKTQQQTVHKDFVCTALKPANILKPGYDFSTYRTQMILCVKSRTPELKYHQFKLIGTRISLFCILVWGVVQWGADFGTHFLFPVCCTTSIGIDLSQEAASGNRFQLQTGTGFCFDDLSYGSYHPNGGRLGQIIKCLLFFLKVKLNISLYEINTN